MKAAQKFFHRYICSTFGILALFFAINVLLIASYFAIASLNGVADSNFPMDNFSQHITMQNGTISADGAAQEMLHRFDAWAMILDDGGTVIWEDGLPEHLPRQYTASEIAMFSRWYLESYAVNVWKLDSGLLVVGFPPGDVFKHNMSFRTAYVWPLVIGIGIALLVNMLLMFCLFWRNAHQVEKAMLPILDGIQALSQGAEVHLNEQGELAEINAGLNRAGAALRQKDHTRSDWIRGISHDIRTPLSVILGYASDMEEDESLPISGRKQAAVIRRQGEKLRTLVADLNLSTKLEYGTLPLQKQKLDPVELERRVVSELLNHGLPETFAIRVSAETFDTPLPLHGDITLLHRMLCNLVSNSIVHNPDGCEIELSVSTAGNCCVFSIADTGREMEDWQIEKLNADESIGSMQSGDKQEEHGLGLKIVRQIAKAHQGKAVFSKNVPRGLCVRVKIAAGYP